MSIKQVPARYQTTDGQEWDNEQDAQRREDLLAAWDVYKEARRTLEDRLGRSQKTADGVPFRLSVFRTYYEVTPGLRGMPMLRKIFFFGISVEWESEGRYGPEGAVSIRQREGEGRDCVERTYRIDRLYYHRHNAEEALLAAQEERLAELASEVEELRRRVVPTLALEEPDR